MTEEQIVEHSPVIDLNHLNKIKETLYSIENMKAILYGRDKLLTNRTLVETQALGYALAGTPLSYFEEELAFLADTLIKQNKNTEMYYQGLEEQKQKRLDEYTKQQAEEAERRYKMRYRILAMKVFWILLVAYVIYILAYFCLKLSGMVQ